VDDARGCRMRVGTLDFAGLVISQHVCVTDLVAEAALYWKGAGPCGRRRPARPNQLGCGLEAAVLCLHFAYRYDLLMEKAHASFCSAMFNQLTTNQVVHDAPHCVVGCSRVSV
jgi:hypothetical protein